MSWFSNWSEAWYLDWNKADETTFDFRYNIWGQHTKVLNGIIPLNPPYVVVDKRDARTDQSVGYNLEERENYNRRLEQIEKQSEPRLWTPMDTSFPGYEGITTNSNDIVEMDVSGVDRPVGRDNVSLHLRDGDDWLTLSGHGATIYGGPGDECLIFKTNGNTVHSGLGDDLVIFEGMTGDGVDIIRTGAGADTVICGASVTLGASSSLSDTDVENVAIAFGFALSRAVAGLLPGGVGGFVSAGIIAIEKYVGFLREAEETESNAQNFQSIRDFDPSLDVYMHSIKMDAQYISEDYDAGKIEIYTDQSKNNSGGIIAELVIDDGFMRKINMNTTLSDSTIRQQISESIVENSLKITKNGGLHDAEGREIDVSEYRSLLPANVYDAVESKVDGIREGMNDGESLTAYGATGGKIIQGGDITSVGITREVWVAGTDRHSDFLVGAKLGHNGSADDVAHMFGFGEDDVLIGTDGDDHITGGRGSDQQTGNAGADTFHYASDDLGHDLITDFDIAGPDHDIIEISEDLFEDYESIQTWASQQGSDTVITLDHTFSITLADIQKDDLSPELFVIV